MTSMDSWADWTMLVLVAAVVLVSLGCAVAYVVDIYRARRADSRWQQEMRFDQELDLYRRGQGPRPSADVPDA